MSNDRSIKREQQILILDVASDLGPSWQLLLDSPRKSAYEEEMQDSNETIKDVISKLLDSVENKEILSTHEYHIDRCSKAQKEHSSANSEVDSVKDAIRIERGKTACSDVRQEEVIEKNDTETTKLSSTDHSLNDRSIKRQDDIDTTCGSSTKPPRKQKTVLRDLSSDLGPSWQLDVSSGRRSTNAKLDSAAHNNRTVREKEAEDKQTSIYKIHVGRQPAAVKDIINELIDSVVSIVSGGSIPQSPVKTTQQNESLDLNGQTTKSPFETQKEIHKEGERLSYINELVSDLGPSWQLLSEGRRRNAQVKEQETKKKPSEVRRKEDKNNNTCMNDQIESVENSQNNDTEEIHHPPLELDEPIKTPRQIKHEVQNEAVTHISKLVSDLGPSWRLQSGGRRNRQTIENNASYSRTKHQKKANIVNKKDVGRQPTVGKEITNEAIDSNMNAKDTFTEERIAQSSTKTTEADEQAQPIKTPWEIKKEVYNEGKRLPISQLASDLGPSWQLLNQGRRRNAQSNKTTIREPNEIIIQKEDKNNKTRTTERTKKHSNHNPNIIQPTDNTACSKTATVLNDNENSDNCKNRKYIGRRLKSVNEVASEPIRSVDNSQNIVNEVTSCQCPSESVEPIKSPRQIKQEIQNEAATQKLTSYLGPSWELQSSSRRNRQRTEETCVKRTNVGRPPKTGKDTTNRLIGPEVSVSKAIKTPWEIKKEIYDQGKRLPISQLASDLGPSWQLLSEGRRRNSQRIKPTARTNVNKSKTISHRDDNDNNTSKQLAPQSDHNKIKQEINTQPDYISFLASRQRCQLKSDLGPSWTLTENGHTRRRARTVNASDDVKTSCSPIVVPRNKSKSSENKKSGRSPCVSTDVRNSCVVRPASTPASVTDSFETVSKEPESTTTASFSTSEYIPTILVTPSSLLEASTSQSLENTSTTTSITSCHSLSSELDHPCSTYVQEVPTIVTDEESSASSPTTTGKSASTPTATKTDADTPLATETITTGILPLATLDTGSETMRTKDSDTNTSSSEPLATSETISASSIPVSDTNIVISKSSTDPETKTHTAADKSSSNSNLSICQYQQHLTIETRKLEANLNKRSVT